MIVYMKTTADKYELPIFVADTAKELAEMVGTTVGCVYSLISKKHKGWAKVEIGEDENEKADNNRKSHQLV